MEIEKNFIAFRDFVKNVLENKFNTFLLEEIDLSKNLKKAVFDLATKDGSHFVEIVPFQKEININKVVDKIFAQNVSIKSITNKSSVRQIVVTQNNLSSDQKKILANKIDSLLRTTDISILDFNDIKSINERLEISDVKSSNKFNSKNNTRALEDLKRNLGDKRIFLGNHNLKTKKNKHPVYGTSLFFGLDTIGNK